MSSLEILEYLLARDGIDVDARSSEDKTPLFLATSLGHIESVEKLIRAGSDVNICDHQNLCRGEYPLHMAYHPDICHLLIRHGARIDAVNRYNKTLLHKLMEHGSLEVVHMLLYYNADANVPDEDCHTTFMAALHHRR
ncbi:26S proteasome non-ATPase regulatory subunit 10-like [Anoplophora glabripennis]|uniref:26S proteasome non-ATPase regulatory subunit 10-like n=1 Tax=Anoplophora glabripennis TaxID=217634 RepID=UPI0008743B76|nr:26S proteasome non-ATPase regulatory subunit 10-like [Anoplophora glabripennis]